MHVTGEKMLLGAIARIWNYSCRSKMDAVMSIQCCDSAVQPFIENSARTQISRYIFDKCLEGGSAVFRYPWQCPRGPIFVQVTSVG